MNRESRKKKLKYNTITSLILQLVTIICGFVLPRLFLQYYGSEVNGLISSISQFLGVIALMQMGVGAVVQSAWYKPLARKNEKEISNIFVSAQRFFRLIGKIFLIYLFLLCIIFPRIIDSNFSSFFSISLILIISVSLLAEYFFGITYQLLLTADQKSYIPNIIRIVSLIINTIVCSILIIKGSSIQIIKLTTSIIFLLRPFILERYVSKHYNIDKNATFVEEPIKQKWNGIAQHIASFILGNTDVMILTIFSSLSVVSVYSVYNLVVSGIRQFVLASTSGMQSLFGNMLANKEFELLEKEFSRFEWLIHTLVMLLFSCTALLIVPFISVYTKGITDTNYIQPVFGILISLSTGMYCLRLPYNIIVLAAGHYKQTQASAIIEASINLIVSIILVFNYGLIGVAIGTLAAMTYRTIYLAHYISNIIHYSFSSFIKHVFVDVLSMVTIFIIVNNQNLLVTNFGSWIILAIKVLSENLVIIGIINFVFYKDSCTLFLKKIFGK